LVTRNFVIVSLAIGLLPGMERLTDWLFELDSQTNVSLAEPDREIGCCHRRLK
jgi:hypothetical protein